MSNSVCERTPARQPKSHSTQFQLSALSLVSAVVIHGVTGLDLAWTVVVILVVVLVAVVPATWPGSAGRRAGFGLDLLGRLLPLASRVTVHR